MPFNLTRGKSNGLTREELGSLRLALSVFQDGSGWESVPVIRDSKTVNVTYAGYRQFERVIAELTGGVAPEDKGIFDVLVQMQSNDFFGISCKMRNTLAETRRTERVNIEVSNAAGKFRRILEENVGNDFRSKPRESGEQILSVVEQWHQQASDDYGVDMDLSASSYLILLYDVKLQFQLFQFRLAFPAMHSLTWSWPPPQKSTDGQSRRLLAVDRTSNEKVIECYIDSGGQLKYYPHVREAAWKSELFTLEPLPEGVSKSILDRAHAYFFDAWRHKDKVS